MDDVSSEDTMISTEGIRFSGLYPDLISNHQLLVHRSSS